MATIRTISIRNPHAVNIIAGLKTIEVHTWTTKHRGRLLIVSSARPTNQGPAGHALGIVDLVDCRPFRRSDAKAAMCPWSPGQFAWILENPRRIKPFPWKGRLGLYEVTWPRPRRPRK
ncbi:MAG TPA: ASCH domain-containing protein [candidate division Zixibacteria bacterium]|nr:ASCH domain-containing protein [candidate division Zixibacteria bacterium]MDD4917119.1 ASCH domain-containing protein [candidate division Zixibacteria bacterium]MDM7972697.1 ASCH domain-containing protein [candidate division Zixibacteria bacterium]HOD65388.1 ASCH domain-containing protein [candidate division Zixibacteria bacterium]HPI32602.1 ASCH domain-containing protein [candidate division Zixibacteria bacterium]